MHDELEYLTEVAMDEEYRRRDAEGLETVVDGQARVLDGRLPQCRREVVVLGTVVDDVESPEEAGL